MNEVKIEGFDRYTLTQEGNVFSYARGKKKLLKPQKASQSKKGYWVARLYNNEFPLGQGHYIHRLVWNHFGDFPIPDGMEIDHIDGDTENNNINNLQCISKRRNILKHVRESQGYLMRDHRDELIEDYKKLKSYKKVAEKWGVGEMSIYRTIKDITHRKIAGTSNPVKYELIRYSDVKDEFTDKDFRYSKNKI